MNDEDDYEEGVLHGIDIDKALEESADGSFFDDVDVEEEIDKMMDGEDLEAFDEEPIYDSRISVVHIFDLMIAGCSAEEIADCYSHVSLEQVEDAFEYILMNTEEVKERYKEWNNSIHDATTTEPLKHILDKRAEEVLDDESDEWVDIEDLEEDMISMDELDSAVERVQDDESEE
jgi:uncharacterized protein (DUF433 family)